MDRPLFVASLVAVLGPTNTGKTHRALTRMREHQSGMIGVPLRLLAREIYDRLSAELGEARVALVTGEEKRVPQSPRYWVCTVEAMPLEVQVDFLAIDEIQLATHAERGHVFTERLLHARGRLETWFMGSATMTELIGRMLPQVEMRHFPRLSELKAAGSYTLGSLGRRSAVVCFSVPRVYEMAERLRARRGGAAIVLGALSPRARNAQVAMYESGEVDYLVATDAIGMGLNLDIDRIAFADTRKFDGFEQRPLTVAELSQIAGRAGRHLKNGEFGVLAPEPRLPLVVERAIENHQLHGERSLVWRNRALDFSSLGALTDSLAERPPLPELNLVRRAEDTETLLHLARQPDIRARASTAEDVELLWETCRIPDYRKLLLEGHANLVGEIFVELHDRGTLSTAFLDSRLRRLERGETDIETLMNRIAFTRTWTYVTFREGWVETPGVWRERTRALEDRLSDALHEALVARFVERRKKVASRAEKVPPKAKAATPFAALEALHLQMTGGEVEVARASLRERAIDAAHEQLSFDADAKIRFEGTALGRVVRGRHVSEPELRLLSADEGAGLERRLERRLRAFLRDTTATVFESWATAAAASLDDVPSSAWRGAVYQLTEGLGSARQSALRPLLALASPAEIEAMKRHGVVLGRYAAYVRALLKPEGLEWRRRYFQVFSGEPLPSAYHSVTRASFAVTERSTTDWLLLGFIGLGPRAVRVDIVEKWLEGKPDAGAPPEQVQSWLGRVAAQSGANKRELRRVQAALERLLPPATPGSPIV